MSESTYKKLVAILAVVLALLVAAFGIFFSIEKSANAAEMARLRNEIAARDSTIEIKEGLYSKLTVEASDMKKLFDSKDAEVKSLLAQVKQGHEELLVANQLVVKWKKAYEAKGPAREEPVPPAEPGGVERTKVNFESTFGAFRVSGYTLTSPGESFLKLEQLKPLVLTFGVSQDKTGAWRAYAASNDSNSAIDVKVSAVNPYMFEPKWYERIEFSATAAGGVAGTNFGALVGVGVSIRFSKFSLGPAGFLTFGDRIDKFLGVTFTYRPFEQERR